MTEQSVACAEAEAEVTKATKTTETTKKTFIAQVSKYGRKAGRKHIEVPKHKRADFNPGDYVRVTPIE